MDKLTIFRTCTAVSAAWTSSSAALWRESSVHTLESEDNEDLYRLVGESYDHGIIYGEAVHTKEKNFGRFVLTQPQIRDGNDLYGRGSARVLFASKRPPNTECTTLKCIPPKGYTRYIRARAEDRYRQKLGISWHQ